MTYTSARRDGVVLFFALACGITWLFDLPLAIAWATGAAPPPYGMTMTGLGALGPSLAAFLVARMAVLAVVAVAAAWSLTTQKRRNAAAVAQPCN